MSLFRHRWWRYLPRHKRRSWWVLRLMKICDMESRATISQILEIPVDNTILASVVFIVIN